jgi:hypothetical protein
MKALRMLVCTLLFGGLPVGSAVWAQDITGGGSLVRFTLDADPFIEWDYAFRDGDGAIVSGFVSDVDGDGVATFVAKVDPLEPNGYLHQTLSTSVCLVLLLVPGQADGPFPLLRDAMGDPLIVESAGAPTGLFSIGQTLTATDGITAGLDGVVHENPGIHSAAALLATDVSALPRYSGGAVVAGLVSYEVIPEPGSLALAVLGLIGISLTRPNVFVVHRRQRGGAAGAVNRSPRSQGRSPSCLRSTPSSRSVPL